MFRVIFFLGVIIFAADAIIFLKTPVTPTDYILKPGSGIVALSKLTKRPPYFVAMALLRGEASRLKAGEYQIRPGTTPRQLLEQVVQGKVIYHSVKLIEGWTFKQFLAALGTQPKLVQTIQGLPLETIMEKLGYPGENPEGRFFPDTYKFTMGTPDLAILKQAYGAMKKRLPPDMSPEAAYKILIIASLIEKETAIDAERPMVAEVILNRLQKNMLLQIDPTVIYALGEGYTGKLRKSDLQVNSPYNTYRYTGLPPTPIAMPGIASIHAALNPTKGEHLYFVARGKGDGTHQFSINLADHNRAVKEF
ncbi:MAG: endolytic transglycosylase MltG, partial [Gammaproteobacteria bacterium]